MPYIFVMNTSHNKESHNKERILEHGWKNVLKNILSKRASINSVDVITNPVKEKNQKRVILENNVANQNKTDILKLVRPKLK